MRINHITLFALLLIGIAILTTGCSGLAPGKGKGVNHNNDSTGRTESWELKKDDFYYHAGQSLIRQIDDMRMFHTDYYELKKRINEKKCLFDVRGLVFSRANSQIHSQSFACENKPKLGVLLDQLDIEIKELGGAQLRVFKVNEVIQAPLVKMKKSDEPWKKIREITIEPGDVVLFTRTG